MSTSYPRFDLRRQKRLRGRRGAVMLETTLVLITFFGLLFMTIDLGRLGFEWMTLNHVVKQVTRWGSLGVVDPNLGTREATIRNRAKNLWSDWGLDPGRLALEFKTISPDPTNNTPVLNTTGGRGDYLIIEGTVTTPLGSFFGVLTGSAQTRDVTLKARGVTRNE